MRPDELNRERIAHDLLPRIVDAYEHGLKDTAAGMIVEALRKEAERAVSESATKKTTMTV